MKRGAARKLAEKWGWLICAVAVSRIMDDTIHLYILAEDMLYHVGKDGKFRDGAIERRQDAMGIFYDAAKNLASTDLASLKNEGIQTRLSNGEASLVHQHAFFSHSRLIQNTNP